MASRRNIRYSSLASDDNDVDSEGSRFDPRFYYTPKAFDKIPWKSIALAIFLLLLGSLLLFLSYFVLTGHMAGEKSQAYGLLALGFLTFLPVVWHLFVELNSAFKNSYKTWCEQNLLSFGRMVSLYLSLFGEELKQYQEENVEECFGLAFMRLELHIMHGEGPMDIALHPFPITKAFLSQWCMLVPSLFQCQTIV
ncbi:transmembrane protein 230 [Cucumis melo var. makuwa]|uniref:Transmembrane protein 230 n=1 Tax=Cucumis melo var. makuwa TaxID=1194695 RepID=A0A5A7T915_CUCMM|nr:transmembrane protein 230 [Cucumis melo var. makuwa]TYK00643.1 transmembrane protein 230 [Cucumis melo var. makuwa]